MGSAQHHNGHHAVQPAKTACVLEITLSVRENKYPSHQVIFRSSFASEKRASHFKARVSPERFRNYFGIDHAAYVWCPQAP